MSLEGALQRARARYAQVLIEACTIQRPTGTTLDPGTDKVVTTYDPVYAGSCRLRPFRSGHPTEAGEVTVEQRGYELHLPWDAPAVQRLDVVTLSVSDDAWVVGRPLTAVEVDYGGTKASHSVLVEDRG